MSKTPLRTEASAADNLSRALHLSSRLPMYSVVVPVYQGEGTIGPLLERLHAVFTDMGRTYEVMFVDDRGPDDSWTVIQSLVKAHPLTVRGIRLSRNFGQHRAITAGLDHVRGEWIVVMDCDLQDVPEEIPSLIRRADEGFDVVLARRSKRSDSFVKRACSAGFYRLLEYLTDSAQDSAVANFGVYHKRVIDAVRNMREDIRYFPLMVRWVGFSRACVDVKHAPRVVGTSGYNFRKAARLAFEVVLAFSDKPLRAAVKGGVCIAIASVGAAAVLLVKALLHSYRVVGWASLMVSMWFLAGMLMFVLGLVGLYVGKAFEQVKGRPLYILDTIADEVQQAEVHRVSTDQENAGRATHVS